MSAAADLIKALAAFMWPAFAIYVVWHFGPEIRSILVRLSHIRKGKVFGHEIELSEELDELQNSAKKAQLEAVEAISQIEPHEGNEINTSIISEEEILRDVEKSPKIALMLLGAKIEKRLRQLLMSTGWARNIPPLPLSKAVESLSAQGSLPQHAGGSLKLFLDVRNKIVHGHQEVRDEDIIRAIDSGLTLLKAIDSIPAEINTIHNPGVDLYSDSTLTTKLPDAKGVILETTSPGGTTRSFRIFPTTKAHFQKGKRVAWEWNREREWGPAWYKDPETKEIKQAWHSAAEFVGRHLDG